MQTISPSPQVANNSSNIDDLDIFKVLSECTKDMGKYRQFIFYVGTSCDNRKLRNKIKRLQEKVFKNILLQRDSIIKFFKKSINAANATPNNKSVLNERDKVERLVCYTLATLTYLESLVQKLTYLTKIFPLSDKIELVVNLGFEDSTINLNDEVTITNENSDTGQNVLTSITNGSQALLKNTNTNGAAALIKIETNNDTYDVNELKNRLHIIQNIREEIEQMDVNLLRYNVKSESNEFIKKIKESTNERVSICDSGDEGDKKTSQTKIKNIKILNMKEFCNRRKCICFIMLSVIVVIIIIGTVLGVVLGTRK